MSNTNPHRFPRPPTLPQSKIQIQSQRELGPADSGHLAMAGRAGGQNTVFGTASEKEEPDSPGTFTTSFDLLSIAKMVPAKQRRVSNAVGINEGQAADTSTVGDSFAESLGVHGDWRKLPSTIAKELPNPDTAKPMIFRRVAIPSSRLARHSNIFASDKTNNAKNKQPVNIGDPGTTTWRNEGFSFFENKNLPSPMEALKALSGRDMRTSGSPQKRHPSVIYNLPGSGQPLNQQQDVKDGWRVDGWRTDGDTSNHERRVHKDISNRKVMHGASEKAISANTGFQTGETAPLDSEHSAPTRFTKISAPMAPVKSSNDSAAGILRAVAEPFEPKRVSSPARAITSKIRVESTSTDTVPLKLRSSLGDSDPFARLIPDSFHKGSTNQPTVSPVVPSHGANGQPSIASAHWKPEGSRRSSEPGEQNTEISKDGPSASRDTTRERSSFSDAGISQLWSFPKGENGSQFANNEPPTNLVGSSVVDPSPGVRSFAVPKTSSDPAPSPGKRRTGQITVRDEAMEQIVPTPRKSLSSDLQIVERLERKAMVLSKSESEIVTALLEEASINDHIQHSIGMENPVPQMDERGRRGAISMQGTVIRRPDNKDTGDHRTNNPTSEVQRNQEPVETRKQIREAWLEPAGEVKIRIREEGSSEPADKYWPYPYTRRDVTAREITTQLFVELNEQMVSYVRMGPDGIRQDHNWGRFKSRKGKPGYLPGHEPWFGGDNTSFFDLSFGATSSYNTGKVTIKPPPGLSLTPVRPIVATEQMKTTQAELGGLRDLVESSTPDYNHYNDDYKKLRARTLQEWNLTPISGGVPTNPFNSHGMLSRQGSNSSSAGQSIYDSTRGQIDGNGRNISSARDGGMFRSTTLTNGSGWKANGQKGMGSPTEVGSETFAGRVRRRRPEQRQFAFGMTGEAGSIVFGGDEGSDGV